MSDSVLLSHTRLAEPLLSFSPSDPSAVHENPLAGLAKFGPHSRALLREQDAIRVLALAPMETADTVAALLLELRNEAQPVERREYLPAYPGFNQAFHTRLFPAAPARIALPADLDARLAASATPAHLLADTVCSEIRHARDGNIGFDVLAIHLPQRWSQYFNGDGVDVHDRIKAYAAQLDEPVPTQVLNDQPMTYRCRASVRWRLGCALYAKAGGTPYKLVTGGLMNPDTVYVGLAYGVRAPGGPDQQFVVCCSQMFDSAGGGLEFVAHDFGNEVDARNPLLSAAQMRTVLSRALDVYADRRAGRRPGSIVVHKQTDFTADEIDGAIAAWGSADNLSCVTIASPAWRGVQVESVSNAGTPRFSYATSRGNLLALDEYSALLWVAGNSPAMTATGHQNYLPGGKGTPRPLQLTRWTGAGPLEEMAAPVLALSKMDFNSDSPYSSLPATIRYAQVLARLVKTEPLAARPYDFRLFM
jgi:hypothetical protein